MNYRPVIVDFILKATVTMAIRYKYLACGMLILIVVKAARPGECQLDSGTTVACEQVRFDAEAGSAVLIPASGIEIRLPVQRLRSIKCDMTQKQAKYRRTLLRRLSFEKAKTEQLAKDLEKTRKTLDAEKQARRKAEDELARLPDKIRGIEDRIAKHYQTRHTLEMQEYLDRAHTAEKEKARTQVQAQFIKQQAYEKMASVDREIERGVHEALTPRYSGDVTHEFTGSGTQPIRPFNVFGEWEIRWQSEGPISIEIRDGEGSYVDAYRRYEASSGSAYQPMSGEYYIQVTSDTPWKIQIVTLAKK